MPPLTATRSTLGTIMKTQLSVLLTSLMFVLFGCVAETRKTEMYSIHKQSGIGKSFEIVSGTSTICQYELSIDDPNVTDDNYGEYLFVIIQDPGKISLNKEYNLPSETISAKGRMRGAWVGSNYFPEFRGTIIFKQLTPTIIVNIKDSLYSRNYFNEYNDTTNHLKLVFKGNMQFK